MIEAFVTVLVGIICYQWIDKHITVNRLERANANICEQWIAERKDLLDRIQAPSFAEYSSKVIREKKAEREEEKPEERTEFVS